MSRLFAQKHRKYMPRSRRPRRHSFGPPSPLTRVFSSILALLIAVLPSKTASAGDILRGGGTSSPTRQPGVSAAGGDVQTEVGAAGRDSLARTAQALQAVKAMQSAARNAAVTGPNNLGLNPNQAGVQLPNVPNGLTTGGLQVAPTVPLNLSVPVAGENRALWTGANLPTQSISGSLTNVTIKQTNQQALLNWQTFNIGKETKLTFDQTAGGADVNKWIAFNKINDPTGNPSQILGSIAALGQVYVINRNGIVFGGSSQINLHTFVASALPINDNLVSQGLLNNRDAQFLFSGLSVPGGSDGTPNFTPEPPPASGRYGDVTVQPGAVLQSPDDGSGGRIMLVGANVLNSGTLSAPTGQTILAAGLQVAVAPHASDDPSLRGLDVFVGGIADPASSLPVYAGTVTNSGLIEAFSGSVSLDGRYVNQLGAIDSSTSVDLNGRIDLRASYGAVGNPSFDNTGAGSGGPPFLFQNTGVVTFGEGSVTQILPDYLSTRTVPGLALPEKSQINVEGLAVYFGENSTMLAPNADVTIRAGVWPYQDIDGNRTTFGADGFIEPDIGSFFSGAEQRFFFSGGQIYLDRSSLINVAGSADVFVPLAQRILQIEFRGSELADSPLQRDGFLRGVPLTVDLRDSGVFNGRFWIGTPLGDVTGLAALIQRNAAQLTAAGGNVSLRAGGSVVVQEGATIDVSGGFFRNEGGLVQTTRLIQGNRLIDIANAFPDQIYDGLYDGFTETNSKFGISLTSTNTLASGAVFEPEYFEGANGGSLSLTAPSMAIDGELRGFTVQGPRQREAPAEQSRLSFTFASEKIFAENPPRFLPDSPTPPEILFSLTATQAPADAFQLLGDAPVALRADRVASVVISPALLDAQGFGHLSVENTDGNITVPVGTDLAAPAFGSISLAGANVTIRSDVSAPGGQLTFLAYNISPAFAAEFPLANPVGALAPPPNIGRGLFTLSPGATLSTAGLIVDDRAGSPGALITPMVLDGGNISIAAFSANLELGSTIDVSGGVAVNGRSQVSYGDAGRIAIRTGRDPGFGRVIGGGLSLASTLLGYSGSDGGSLTLQAGVIQIGGNVTFPNTLLLRPEFFSEGGFTNYSLLGIGAPSDEPVGVGEPETYIPGIIIAAGTRIEPVAESLMAVPLANSPRIILNRFLEPVGVRAPASVSFTALGSDDSFTTNILEVRGDIVMQAGAQIITDPGTNISFRGQTVSLLGSATAPGGTILIAGAGEFPLEETRIPTFAQPTVYLGPQVRLSTAGTAVFLPDPFNLRVGRLLPGGTISVSGNIVAEAGAILDVSGSSEVFDLDPNLLGGAASPIVPPNSGLTGPPLNRQTVATRLDSNGGLIDLDGSQMLFSDATLLGRAGGPMATGGTLSVFSGRFTTGLQTSADISLIVTQSGNVIPATNTNSGIGVALLDESGIPFGGIGYFAADRFAQGGFESLDLGFKFVGADPSSSGGNVEFRGPVSITAPGNLRLAAGGVIEADAAVSLRSSYFAVGQPFRPPLHPDDALVSPFTQIISGVVRPLLLQPSFGPGSLTVKAELIDIGILSLQNIGAASLIADGGDIRGNGTLNIAGDLLLRAAQIYPTTLSMFNIFAYNHAGTPGSITIVGSGSRETPLSAGGNLNVFASTISQGGVLRAPLGSIALGWDGIDLDPSDPDLDRPFNPIAGNLNPTQVTRQVTLESGSITSVAVLTNNGSEMLIPFGLSPDGSSWIDPRGVNVTIGGLPEKRVAILGDSVISEVGSTVDLRGGGDFYAYRFVPGAGGSIDFLGTASSGWSAGTEYVAGDLVNFGGRTWSARVRHAGQTPSSSPFWSLVAESFAVLPAYQSEFAPYASFNTGANAELLGGDPGYVGDGLQVGDRIFLEASPGLSAGFYTLLPRRYALLPGAFLITPENETPVGTVTLPEGASLVSGYRLNDFSQAAQSPALRTRFEAAPFEVLRNRAQYDNYLGNAFFAEAATRFEVGEPQRLPIDAGYLAIQGITVLSPDGGVLTSHPSKGRGALVDLSSLAPITIVGGNGAPGGATALLNTDVLGAWGAESLLIGGSRRSTAAETLIDVRTSSVVLDNPGALFSAPDITLVSSATLTMTAGSSIAANGSLSNSAVTFSIAGAGTLLRVSGDPGASIVRTNVSGVTGPLMTIGANTRIAGAGVILDSTYGTSLDPSALLEAGTLVLGSGQISILFDQSLANLAGSVVSPHLVISGQFLEDVQQVDALVLNSYRTIDLYGAGTFGSESLETLSLFAAGIRGYDQGLGTVVFQAADVLFDNPSNVGALAAPGLVSGSLAFNTETLRLGSNTFSIAGYEAVFLSASAGVLGQGSGTFATPANLTITTPLITGTGGSTQAFTAGGALVLARGSGVAAIDAELGASFAFTGASVLVNTSILLPSGQLELRATTGDVTIGGELDVSGRSQEFFDLTRYSDAGNIVLTSVSGDIELLAGSSLSVAAAGLGRAGNLTLNAANGTFINQGTLLGSASEDANSGTFLLDVLSTGDYASLNDPLQAGGFFNQCNIRVRTGAVTIDGLTRTLDFTLSADAGPIIVSGTIDASGVTGGKIALISGGSLTLEAGSLLSVHAAEFSSAGRGGAIRLESGAAINGVANPSALLDLRTGSVLDLGVDAFVAGAYTDPAASAFRGQFQGTLHLRAPRSGNDVRVAALEGEIRGASSILVEGFRVYDRTAQGTLDTTLRDAIDADSNSYMNAGYAAMEARLLGSNPGLSDVLVIAPGVEIINRTGDLVLGTDADDSSNDWDLSSFRYGPKNAPGILTIRAAGNLEFKNALSDGFAGDFSPDEFPNPGQELWLRPLMNIVQGLPVNTQSWSYRLVAGADLSAANVRGLRPLDTLPPEKGSLLVGKFYPANLVFGPDATTASAIDNRFQVIRTGTGNIDIAAGRDVQLRNQFATIYTAGIRLPYSNTIASQLETRLMSISSPNDFAVPFVELGEFEHPFQGSLGAVQQVYPAQYSMAGGNVTVFAQEDIGRFTLFQNEIVPDSSRQLPNNWLYRRGFVDPATGLFGEGGVEFLGDRSASTTWWVDFSNFFQGFGALGGGNVTLVSGRDIINADAVAPTNARMPGRNGATGANVAPDASRLLELGGGSVTVRAGNNIDGGVYYVERGDGSLSAGGEIKTNSARSPSLGILGSSFNNPPEIVQSTSPSVLDPLTWLPTTLFVGKAQFDVSAAGDILLGPVTNPFFLPQGLNNKFWYKTYFNTYSPDAGVSVSSFGGSVTHRLSATLPGTTNATPILGAWLDRQNRLTSENASFYEPWIRLAEAEVSRFATVATVDAPTLRSTAFAGDVTLVGDLNLFPSPQGTLELAAAGGLLGLAPSGRVLIQIDGQSRAVTAWTTASVNLSDADPGSLPGVTTPLAYQALVGNRDIALRQTLVDPFLNINPSFRETGSFSGNAGSLETRRALHAPGPLHAGDSEPVRLYALGGDITAFTLFTPKSAQIAAGHDITDVAFYIQNISPENISFVSAGRDIIPFNENGQLRSTASDTQRGNTVVPSLLDKSRATVTGTTNISLEGDIQISGPGVLEVLAGRNLDLGTGANLVDGTGVGITSIGNFRNPFLPFDGADIIALAGVEGFGGSGPAVGLSNSSLLFDAFIDQYITDTSKLKSDYLESLGLTGAAFDSLSPEQQAIVALEVFYRLLRDAGRNSSTTGSFASGLDAIKVLFGTTERAGEILTRARDIRTSTGGRISIGAPGGGIAMATDIFGNPLTPPGIVTESGGSISIFTDQDVSIGQARIFTLRGGDITIWSSEGDIAAGSAPRTVVTAPPTRVVIDVTSADVQTDLGGLATGGGIGVLASVRGVKAGDVDLIAPEGIVDAGDAGIRVTGNLSIAAVAVLNSGNISVGGSSAGVPTVAAPNLGGLNAASNASGATNAAGDNVQTVSNTGQEALPSIITVEVLGYGGGDGDPDGTEDEEEKKRRRRSLQQQQQEQEPPPPEPLPQGSTSPAPSYPVAAL